MGGLKSQSSSFSDRSFLPDGRCAHQITDEEFGTSGGADSSSGVSASDQAEIMKLRSTPLVLRSG